MATLYISLLFLQCVCVCVWKREFSVCKRRRKRRCIRQQRETRDVPIQEYPFARHPHNSLYRWREGEKRKRENVCFMLAVSLLKILIAIFWLIYTQYYINKIIITVNPRQSFSNYAGHFCRLLFFRAIFILEYWVNQIRTLLVIIVLKYRQSLLYAISRICDSGMATFL